MFEKFNEAARRALFFSRSEAARVGSFVIAAEHILLGILREGDAVTKQLWATFHLLPEDIRRQFPDVATDVPTSAELPLGEDAKKVLAYASHEADQRADAYVGPAHLVLGLLRVPEGRAAEILSQHGVAYDVASEVVRVMNTAIQREERTPITLRAPHYELLDQLAEAMNLTASRRENRQAIVLAIMDAIVASPVPPQSLESLDDLRRRLRDAFA